MALFHRATIVPTKEQIISEWVPLQAWGPPADTPVTVIGAFRFDDPQGAVGMETFLATAGDQLLQVPLTYRDAPLEGADDALISEMDHSALGRRWVYDGLRDPLYLVMLAAVAMTGQGEALGMAEYESRWYIAPSGVRIQGGEWSLERVPVDGFTTANVGEAVVNFANERFELTVYRQPRHQPRPPIGLTATWIGHADPVVLAELRELPK
ncbi:MAG: hypothetical protein ABL953_09410 [Ilumatobacteraceae bacterium]